ncbi:hypothetical protein DFH09DRAFT_1337120 [Mycena vulgaris]|nr:hypothetical protein DFH09DRAFT_1337120 [Mycena vulgaris]
MTLVQELLDLIVQNVENTPSLKACSLASSHLRGASQRIILSHLNLRNEDNSESSNFDRVAGLLRESPHIAVYVTDLSLALPSDRITDTEMKCLQQILSDLMLFLSCNPLSSLWIRAIEDIPPAVIFRLITSVPPLSSLFVDVCPTMELLPEIPECRSAWIDPLDISDMTQDTPKLLSRPKFASCMSKIRSLWLPSQDSMDFVRAAAGKLEFLQLDYQGVPDSYSSMPFPIFPCLRCFGIDIGFREYTEPWFIDSIASVLSNSNTIDGIIVVCSCEEPLAAAPSIEWRLSLSHGGLTAEEITEMSLSIQKAMPHIHAKGKLMLSIDWLDMDSQ